jgi:hypothetical protein
LKHRKSGKGPVGDGADLVIPKVPVARKQAQPLSSPQATTQTGTAVPSPFALSIASSAILVVSPQDTKLQKDVKIPK